MSTRTSDGKDSATLPGPAAADARPADLLATAVAELQAERTYCKSCGYSLKGLTEHRCPECGREFNRDQDWTTTTERGREQRLRFAASSIAACITFFALPIVLAMFTDVLYLDLIAAGGVVVAYRLHEKPTTGGNWLAILFGVYVVMAASICITLDPLDISTWEIRRHSIPIYHPLVVAVWSAVNLHLWHRWARAKKGMIAASD